MRQSDAIIAYGFILLPLNRDTYVITERARPCYIHYEP